MIHYSRTVEDFKMKFFLVLFVLVLITSQTALAKKGVKKSTKPKQTNATATVAPVTVPTTTGAVIYAGTSTTRRPLLEGVRLPCTCTEGQCGCCTGYILDRFNQKACMNFTYEPDDFALTASMTMNNRVLYKNTVSGKNPPPMCVRVPRLQFIKLCVEFSNIYFASRNIHLCVDMEANWEDFTLIDWSFDCMRMGASGFAVISPEDGGGVPNKPIDSVDQTDEDYDDNARNNMPILINKNIMSSSVKHEPKIIFDSKLKQLTNQTANITLIKTKKLANGDYLITLNSK